MMYMTRDATPSLDEITRTARELPEERRFAYLRTACAGHDELYRRAIALFQPEISHPEWWSDATATNRPPGDQTLGMVIGRYVVTARIGAGGMSDVLLGEAQDGGPTVAIKLIRNATASAQLHSRLKAERQILGTLNHPNIARLLDGGNTHGDTPYLVMEYVQGERIDHYCNHLRLTVPQRLRLFQSVCLAVHEAHRLSIVHRDLKPSNILVTVEGVPKLMDFGIAKILDERRADQTLVVTHVDVRLLTPEYASPEQIRGDDVTIASDIYALGVLLYELLAGYNPRATRPTDRRAARRDDSLPDPLNDRLTAHLNGAAPAWLAELCRQRSTTPVQLHHDLAALTMIVLTAMHSVPGERHVSARQFAERLDQYLAGAPVKARPAPSAPVQQSTSHRSPVLAITVAVIVVCVILAWLLYRAAR